MVDVDDAVAKTIYDDITSSLDANMIDTACLLADQLALVYSNLASPNPKYILQIARTYQRCGKDSKAYIILGSYNYTLLSRYPFQFTHSHFNTLLSVLESPFDVKSPLFARGPSFDDEYTKEHLITPHPLPQIPSSDEKLEMKMLYLYASLAYSHNNPRGALTSLGFLVPWYNHLLSLRLISMVRLLQLVKTALPVLPRFLQTLFFTAASNSNTHQTDTDTRQNLNFEKLGHVLEGNSCFTDWQSAHRSFQNSLNLAKSIIPLGSFYLYGLLFSKIQPIRSKYSLFLSLDIFPNNISAKKQIMILSSSNTFLCSDYSTFSQLIDYFGQFSSFKDSCQSTETIEPATTKPSAAETNNLTSPKFTPELNFLQIWERAETLFTEHRNPIKSLKILSIIPESILSNSSPILRLMAKCFHSIGRLEHAYHLFQQSIAIDPTDPTDLSYFSTILWHQKKRFELVRLSANLIRVQRFHPETWIVVAHLFSLQNHHFEAINFLKRSQSLLHGLQSMTVGSGHFSPCLVDFPDFDYNLSEFLNRIEKDGSGISSSNGDGDGTYSLDDDILNSSISDYKRNKAMYPHLLSQISNISSTTAHASNISHKTYTSIKTSILFNKLYHSLNIKNINTTSNKSNTKISESLDNLGSAEPFYKIQTSLTPPYSLISLQSQKSKEIYIYSLCILGHEYLAIGSIDFAKQCFQKALESDILTIASTNHSAWFGLGCAIAKTGDYKESIKYLEKAYNLFPYSSDIASFYASVLSQLGFAGKAAILFHKAITLAPDNHLAQLRLAGVFIELHRYRDALILLLRLLSYKDFDKDANTLISIGNAYCHILEATLANTEDKSRAPPPELPPTPLQLKLEAEKFLNLGLTIESSRSDAKLTLRSLQLKDVEISKWKPKIKPKSVIADGNDPNLDPKQLDLLKSYPISSMKEVPSSLSSSKTTPEHTSADSDLNTPSGMEGVGSRSVSSVSGYLDWTPVHMDQGDTSHASSSPFTPFTPFDANNSGMSLGSNTPETPYPNTTRALATNMISTPETSTSSTFPRISRTLHSHSIPHVTPLDSNSLDIATTPMTPMTSTPPNASNNFNYADTPTTPMTPVTPARPSSIEGGGNGNVRNTPVLRNFKHPLLASIQTYTNTSPFIASPISYSAPQVDSPYHTTMLIHDKQPLVVSTLSSMDPQMPDPTSVIATPSWSYREEADSQISLSLVDTPLSLYRSGVTPVNRPSGPDPSTYVLPHGATHDSNPSLSHGSFSPKTPSSTKVGFNGASGSLSGSVYTPTSISGLSFNTTPSMRQSSQSHRRINRSSIASTSKSRPIVYSPALSKFANPSTYFISSPISSQSTIQNPPKTDHFAIYGSSSSQDDMIYDSPHTPTQSKTASDYDDQDAASDVSNISLGSVDSIEL